jgi:hypothetical protein
MLHFRGGTGENLAQTLAQGLLNSKDLTHFSRIDAINKQLTPNNQPTKIISMKTVCVLCILYLCDVSAAGSTSVKAKAKAKLSPEEAVEAYRVVRC